MRVYFQNYSKRLWDYDADSPTTFFFSQQPLLTAMQLTAKRGERQGWKAPFYEGNGGKCGNGWIKQVLTTVTTLRTKKALFPFPLYVGGNGWINQDLTTVTHQHKFTLSIIYLEWIKNNVLRIFKIKILLLKLLN